MKLNTEAPALYYANYHEWKNEAHECAKAGLIPIHPKSPTWDRLDELEYSLDLDWIEYDEFENSRGEFFEGISINSAWRLFDMGVTFDDVDQFLELFCSEDYLDEETMKTKSRRCIVEPYWTEEAIYGVNDFGTKDAL